MARYTEAKCRICRREGAKLFLKGDRCYTDKCAYERRPYAPGQHGRIRKKMSDYAIQLREKQKTRRMYGILEDQFRAYFQRADMQKGVTGENLLSFLERRLDNVVYRLGFANSRNQARQLVRHGLFTLNGHRVTIPSMREVGSGTQHALVRAFEAAGVDGRAIVPVLSVHSSLAVLECVEAGLGVAVVSQLAAKPYLDRQAVCQVPVPHLPMRRQFVTLSHARRYRFPALRAFLASCEAR